MMNTKASRHPSITICELQCPMCGEIYYTTEEDLDESDNVYECEVCGYEADVSEWPWQELVRGRVTVDDDSIIIEEKDW